MRTFDIFKYASLHGFVFSKIFSLDFSSITKAFPVTVTVIYQKIFSDCCFALTSTVIIPVLKNTANYL